MATTGLGKGEVPLSLQVSLCLFLKVETTIMHPFLGSSKASNRKIYIIQFAE